MSRAEKDRATPGGIVLAAGGTGGHMFPAQALARELLDRGLSVVLVTDRRGGGFGPDLPQVETHRINAAGLTGRGFLGKLRGVLALGLGLVLIAISRGVDTLIFGLGTTRLGRAWQ